MSATLGRKVTLTPTNGGPTLTGMRSKSITIGDTEIDATQGESDGWRHLLPDSSLQWVDVGIEAFVSEGSLLAAAIAAKKPLANYVLDIDGIGEFSGTFRIPSGGITIDAVYNEGAKISFTLKSSSGDQVSFTAYTPPAAPIDPVDVVVGSNGEGDNLVGQHGWNQAAPFGSVSAAVLDGANINRILSLHQTNVPFQALFLLGMADIETAQSFIDAHSELSLRIETGGDDVVLSFADAEATDDANDQHVGVCWRSSTSGELDDLWQDADLGITRRVSVE